MSGILVCGVVDRTIEYRDEVTQVYLDGNTGSVKCIETHGKLFKVHKSGHIEPVPWFFGGEFVITYGDVEDGQILEIKEHTALLEGKIDIRKLPSCSGFLMITL